MNFKILILKTNAFEKTDAFVFSDLRVHSWGRKGAFKKVVLYEVGEYFLSFVQNIWCLVMGLTEKDNSVTGWLFWT